MKGIGRWTAEMFLIFHLMRPDVLPLADIGLQRAMRLHYNGGRALTVARMRSWARMGAVALGRDVVSVAEPGCGAGRGSGPRKRRDSLIRDS